MKVFAITPQFAVSLALAAFLSACSPPQAAKKEANQSVKVKGDPFQVVKGSLMESENTIPAEFFMDGAPVTVTSMAFSEGPADANSAGVLDAEKAKESGPEAVRNEVTAKKLVSGVWSVSGVSEGTPLKIDFDKHSDSKLKFKKIEWNGEDLSKTDHFELLHVSHNLKRGTASLLFYYGRPSQRSLLAVYLLSPLNDNLAFPGGESNDGIYYAFGRGFKLGWLQKNPVTVKVCGERPAALKKIADDAAAVWTGELKGRLSFGTEDAVICPPFSDVNTRTLTFVDQWLEVADPQLSKMGSTSAFGRLSSFEIIDSDVFIFMNEVAKLIPAGSSFDDESIYAQKPVHDVFRYTLIHELGHLLGLGHPEEKIESIMAYQDRLDLTDYDRKAIKSLYPLQ
jgi:hypothetical protein